MNYTQLKSMQGLPKDIKRHRPIQVSKNPSNLISIINVNQKYRNMCQSNNQNESNLTAKFLLNLCNEDLSNNYQYDEPEYISSLIVHRNPLFVQKQQAQLK